MPHFDSQEKPLKYPEDDLDDIVAYFLVKMEQGYTVPYVWARFAQHAYKDYWARHQK